MNRIGVTGLAFLAIVVFAFAVRAIYTSRTLDDLREAEAARQKVSEEALKTERARLNGELLAIEANIRSVEADGDRQMRSARAAEADAATKHRAAREAVERYKSEHRIMRWASGSAVSMHIAKQEEEADGIACARSRFDLASRAANAAMIRKVRALNQRKRLVEEQVAALRPPTESVELPSWLDVFLGLWSRPAEPQPLSPRPRTAIPAPLPLFTYALPDIRLEPAPVHRTTLFEALDIRSASELSKWLAELGKQVQDTAIRIWKKEEEGDLVDLTVGCRKVTLNKPVAEALWAKYQYFLAQTDYQCEVAPTSDFREYLRQRALRNEMSKAGTPVAKPIDSKHVIGDALDQSARCQSGRVPFDFDPTGRVIFVRVDDRGMVVDEPEVREAIVSRRKAEFVADYTQLVASRGDVKAWEAAQYDAAIHELLRFPPGTGIYGAHVMSFEAGLKAGLVGAFCGIRHDPVHSELSIGGSRAECGEGFNGNPACYRVDATGKPDCWRGSPKWNEMVDAERKRSWGSRYAQTYGPGRLDRYLPKTVSQAGGEGR